MPVPVTTMSSDKARSNSPPDRKISRKASGSSSASNGFSSTSTALRTLYNRAARAFLHRDIEQTWALIESAFELINGGSEKDIALGTDRKKWEILKITVVVTLYTTGSARKGKGVGNKALESYVKETPHGVLTRLYRESAALYSTSSVPSQVAATLVYSSLKLGCPKVGRVVVEDWLASVNWDIEREEYAKMLELYCLQVLPKLEEWDYAREFLEYEFRLEDETREAMKATLASIHEQSSRTMAVDFSSVPVLASNGDAPSSRPYSPAPSSSSSSSLSTTSTHTVVPSSALSSMHPRSMSATSLSSATTTTPRRQKSSSPSRSSTSSLIASRRFPPLHTSNRQNHALTARDLYSLLRSHLAPYLSASRAATFVLIFVLLPLCSVLMRLRRRSALPRLSSTSHVDLVRRRLDGSNGVLSALARSFIDFVRMGQGGLV